MAEPGLLVERDGAIVTLTFNRPAAMNALNNALRRDLVDTFRSLTEDTSAEVVIVTGRGKAFTAGLDLKEIAGETGSGGIPGAGTPEIDIGAAISAFPRPIIAAVNGYAITGGFEIALMCDLVVCSTQARFADTHVRVGVVPGWGLSQRLPRLIGIQRAKEISLTGNVVTADRAYEWGFANRVVAPEALMPTARALAADIVSGDRRTREEVLRILDAGWERSLGEGLEIEHRASEAFLKEITPEHVASRRRSAQARARSQT